MAPPDGLQLFHSWIQPLDVFPSGLIDRQSNSCLVNQDSHTLTAAFSDSETFSYIIQMINFGDFQIQVLELCESKSWKKEQCSPLSYAYF